MQKPTTSTWWTRKRACGAQICGSDATHRQIDRLCRVWLSSGNRPWPKFARGLWRLKMDGEQIERLLRNIKEFDGVFAIDDLPDNPRLLVCNLDPSHRRGSHWICICVNGTVGEYFDSLGRAPNLLLERYMIAKCSKCSKWTYNRRQLQSVLSAFCRHYCVYFLPT